MKIDDVWKIKSFLLPLLLQLSLIRLCCGKARQCVCTQCTMRKTKCHPIVHRILFNTHTYLIFVLCRMLFSSPRRLFVVFLLIHHFIQLCNGPPVTPMQLHKFSAAKNSVTVIYLRCFLLLKESKKKSCTLYKMLNVYRINRSSCCRTIFLCCFVSVLLCVVCAQKSLHFLLDCI